MSHVSTLIAGPGRGRRFPARAGVRAVAASTTLGLLWLTGCTAAVEGGPLLAPPDNVYFPTYERGDVFTDGFQSLMVRGKNPAVVQSVEMVGVEGLELIDVLYAGPDRKIAAIQVMDGFPPHRRTLGKLAPVEGATVPPGNMGLELIIGLRVTNDGFAYREGLRIHYRVGDTRYVTEFPSSIAVCPERVGWEACEKRWLDLTS